MDINMATDPSTRWDSVASAWHVAHVRRRDTRGDIGFCPGLDAPTFDLPTGLIPTIIIWVACVLVLAVIAPWWLSLGVLVSNFWLVWAATK